MALFAWQKRLLHWLVSNWQLDSFKPHIWQLGLCSCYDQRKVGLWRINSVGLQIWVFPNICIAQMRIMNCSNSNCLFFLIQYANDHLCAKFGDPKPMNYKNWLSEIFNLQAVRLKNVFPPFEPAYFSYALMFPILAWFIVTDSLPLWFESACSKIELRAGEKQRELLACWTKFRICKRLSSVSRVL